MCPFCACRAPAHLQTHTMFGETVLAIDPGVAVAAAAAMRGGGGVFAASAALAGPPAAWGAGLAERFEPGRAARGAAFGGHPRNRRRAVAIVRRLLPPADIALLRAASPRGRADPFDAALFLDRKSTRLNSS